MGGLFSILNLQCCGMLFPQLKSRTKANNLQRELKKLELDLQNAFKELHIIELGYIFPNNYYKEIGQASSSRDPRKRCEMFIRKSANTLNTSLQSSNSTSRRYFNNTKSGNKYQLEEANNFHSQLYQNWILALKSLCSTLTKMKTGNNSPTDQMDSVFMTCGDETDRTIISCYRIGTSNSHLIILGSTTDEFDTNAINNFIFQRLPTISELL